MPSVGFLLNEKTAARRWGRPTIFQAQHGELPGVKGAGEQAKLLPLPPSQADASSVVSSALAYSPDVVEIEKYAPAKMPVDSPALAGMSSVMNIWSAFHHTPTKQLTSSYMLKTLRSGSHHPNFLANPYTCDGKAIPAEPAICNAGQKLYQIKNGQPTLITAGPYLAGVKYAG